MKERPQLRLTLAVQVRPWARAVAWIIGFSMSLHVQALDFVMRIGRKR